MLDGALAVPCNLKSALAGFNPEGRVWLLLFDLVSGVDVFSSTQCSNTKFRQVWKEAAVENNYMCRKLLELSWLYKFILSRKYNPRCTKIKNELYSTIKKMATTSI